MKFEVGDKVRLKNELIEGHPYYELLGKVGLISSIEFKFMNSYYVFFPDCQPKLEPEFYQSDIENLSWQIWVEYLELAE